MKKAIRCSLRLHLPGWTILLLVLLSNSGHAQTQSTLFEKTWGYSNPIWISYCDELPGGDFIFIGRNSVYGNAISWGPSHFYMCRTDKFGNLLWEKFYGDTFNMYYLSGIRRTRQGNYLLLGEGNDQYSGTYLLETDPDGREIFFKQYTTPHGNFSYTVDETADNGFILCGAEYTLQPGNYIPMLIRTDASGNQLWIKKQDSLSHYVPELIKCCPDGGFLAEGMIYLSSTTTQFTAKYSASGQMQWINYPLGANVADLVRGLTVHDNGNFDIPVCESNSPNDTRLKTFDPNGNEISDSVIIRNFQLNYVWGIFNLCEEQPGFDSSVCSVAMPDPYGPEYILQTDKSWHVSIKDSIPISSHGYAIYACPTRDGGCLAAGNYSPDSQSPDQYYMIKFSSDGRHEAEAFDSSVEAYPVPSIDGNINLTFDMKHDEDLDVKIYSEDGKLVYEQNLFVSANTHTELPVRLDLVSAANGIYFLEAATSRHTYRRKLIVGPGYSKH